MAAATPPAHASGTFAIGGELVVHRLGFGAMRLPGVRDLSVPVDGARALLREAVRLGVDLIDTAWIYGRSEELIADALHPYPTGSSSPPRAGWPRAVPLMAGPSGFGRTARTACDAFASTRSTSGNCTASIPTFPSRTSSA